MTDPTKKIIKEILANSLVGLPLQIISHTDNGLKGRYGIIKEETKQMIVLTTSKGDIKIAKINGVFTIEIEGQNIKVNGKLLYGLPKMRRKRKVKNW